MRGWGLGNYLRVRGEYAKTMPSMRGLMELPPRARRILYRFNFCPCTEGTTSACAENTGVELWCISPFWNYLRVRGEYVMNDGDGNVEVELPPRARRIQDQG